jgi:hypothetical protein
MVVRSVELALDKLIVGRVTRKIILYSPEIDAAIFLKMSFLMVLVNVRLVLMLFLDVSVVIFFLVSLSATLVEVFTKNPAQFAVNQVMINILMVQVDVVHAFPPLSGVLPAGSPMVWLNAWIVIPLMGIIVHFLLVVQPVLTPTLIAWVDARVAPVLFQGAQTVWWFLGLLHVQLVTKIKDIISLEPHAATRTKIDTQMALVAVKHALIKSWDVLHVMSKKKLQNVRPATLLAHILSLETLAAIPMQINILIMKAVV